MGVVILVRHAQASFGADDYDVLSETGWEQGRLLGDWLRERAAKPTAVVRGSMRRHRETCQAIRQSASGWSDATVDPGWDEFDHLGVVAAYPEVPPDDLDNREFQRLLELATARWTAGEHDGEYDESWSAFRARVTISLEAACARAGPGGSVVVVTSGGPIAAACAALIDPGADDATFGRLWSRLNTTIVNTSFTRLVVGSAGARMLTFNEHPHLEGDHLTYR